MSGVRVPPPLPIFGRAAVWASPSSIVDRFERETVSCQQVVTDRMRLDGGDVSPLTVDLTRQIWRGAIKASSVDDSPVGGGRQSQSAARFPGLSRKVFWVECCYRPSCSINRRASRLFHARCNREISRAAASICGFSVFGMELIEPRTTKCGPNLNFCFSVGN